ncbi:MAG: SDR family oxidoreductase [Clostridia bacterium]|nr:SDR family oxidoreductase [Clostridia bacterium]
MYQVKGKWALITGAARGIGYLTAKFMAEQGCNLILHSRDLRHTERVLDEVRFRGVSAVAVAADLNDLSAVERMLEEIDSIGVDVDIVMNNAGLQIAYRTDYCATPAEDYEISFRVNTIAPAMICYHFLPKMMAKGTGRILNTTSGIALDVCQAGYSASKAALDKITIDLGSKVEGTDVLINLTDPGWCRTDLGGRSAPNAPESAIPGIAVGVFVDDRKSGRYLGAQHFTGMTIGDAVKKAEAEFDSPYGK